MNQLLAALVTVLVTGNAVAGPTCNKQKKKWMNESAFKAQLTQQGYQIKTFKVSKGQCYEIYGFDKAGKKVEIYFNPQTAAVLEAK